MSRPPSYPRPSPPTTPASTPLIPESLFHPTEQRLYALAIFGLIQAYKLYQWISTPSISLSALYGADTIFFFLLPFFRIPRLSFTYTRTLINLSTILSFNWLIMEEGWRLIPFGSLVPASFSTFFVRYNTLSNSYVSLKSIIQPDQHLTGVHTLHIQPFSTARIGAAGVAHGCISVTNPTVFIPLSFNSSTPPWMIEYTLTPLGAENFLYFNVTAESLEEMKVIHHRTDDEELLGDSDELSDDELEEIESILEPSRKPTITKDNSYSGLTLLLPIQTPGTIRLSRVIAPSHSDFRISTSPIVIYPCPTAEIINTSSRRENCIGSEDSVEVLVSGVGLESLRVGYLKRSPSNRIDEGWIEGLGYNEALSDGALVQTHNNQKPSSFTARIPLTFIEAGNSWVKLAEVSSPLTPIIDLRKTSETVHFSTLPSPDVQFSTTSCPNGLIKILDKQYRNDRKILAPQLLLYTRTVPSGDTKNGYSVSLSYQPSDLSLPPKAILKKMLKASVNVGEVEEGTYTLQGVQNGICPGTVKEPSECRIEVMKRPTVGVEIRAMRDECAGDVGVVLSLTLTGQSPFSLHYTSTFTSSSSSNSRVREKKEVHHTSSLISDLPLQPETAGEWVYNFISISDANYKEVPLLGSLEPIKTVVRPLGSGELLGLSTTSSRGKRPTQVTLWECQPKKIDLDLTLKGTAPFSIELFISNPDSTHRVVNISDLIGGTESIQVDVEEGGEGTRTINLISVMDGNGCKRKISSDVGVEVKVDVKYDRPSVKFSGTAESRKVLVREGNPVPMGLMLKGQSPWSVKYINNRFPQDVRTIYPDRFNADLMVTDAGTYTLLEVSDNNCPGKVDEAAHTWTISHLPKPMLAFSPEAGIFNSKSDSYIRAPVCVGVDDKIRLQLTGKAPFNIEYQHTLELDNRKHPPSHSQSTGSLQSSMLLPLETNVPGVHYYHFNKIADENYDKPAANLQTQSKKSDRLVLQQEVYGRPSANFESPHKRLSVCSQGKLKPSTDDFGAVVLKGKAPFELDLVVRSMTGGQTLIQKHTVKEIKTHRWVMDVPELMFSTTGEHSVSIERVRDSSGCEMLIAGGSISNSISSGRIDDIDEVELVLGDISIGVDVAETASVVSLNPERDLCVGTEVVLTLQGSPPWTLTYDWAGHSFSDKVYDSRFSRMAERAGTFAVKSIAHQKNQCKVDVDDIVNVVHAIPKAKISLGRTFIETLEEGDQSEILFDFEGEPPFSFTYTRSAQDKAGRIGEILETHTVTNVMESHYSIFASTEGTWRVTMIQDRYCRFPTLDGVPLSAQKRITI